MDGDFVIVTPTYPPDAGRCALLVESLDRCCPNVHHYLIIDRHDVGAFRHLVSGRTEIIESEAVVEPWLKRLPTRHGIWVGLKSLPVRGWMMQQIRKIAVAKHLGAPNIIFCDSDMAFIRPFGLDDLLVDGQLGLLDVEFQDASVRTWTAIARRLLGVPENGGPVRGHVGQMIAWRREHALGMQQRIEAVTGRSWQEAVARLRTFSEYILYGVYVREVLGYATSGHAPSTIPLVKTSWDHDMISSAGLEQFFASFDERTIAMMAHSKSSIDQHRLRELMELQWTKAAAG